MHNNENIICISSIDWDFIWQGHQEIMSAYARNGNRVLFIENTGVRVPGIRDAGRVKKRIVNWFKGIKGFREVSENLYVYSPVLLPFPYSRLSRWINRSFLLGSLRRWAGVMNFSDAIVWTFLPTGTALDIIDEFAYKCLVYYCIADFNKLANIKRVRKTEDALIKKADIIFAQGRHLEEKCRRFNRNVHIFPFGVNINVFNKDKELSSGNNYADIKNIKKPIIGYIGGIHRHIDFALLAYIAKRNPDSSVVLIGPVQTDISALKDIRNIIFLGKKDFHLLPGYIREFAVCIIPYLKSGYTNTVYPTKLNEYHALGKPVVSTDIPEITAFNQENGNLVFIAGTKEEFVKKIKAAMGEKDSALTSERIRSAKGHSWDVRIEEMSNLIEDAINKKKLNGYPNWQERFKHLYRAARRRLARAAFVFLVLWGVIFYTPLVWFLAEPLKIANHPEKADCIVVFAGGVGESGKAGQGYEERVDYAVKLFKQGHAGYLIFSSGYKFVFNEAAVMKYLAMSLGVPEARIILEENAGNTYLNVKFTKEILDKRNWRKVLLVSSPYHMRRVSLVAGRLAPGITFIYTPIQSRFYEHEIGTRSRIAKRIDLKQIKGIIHEYLGIIYYRIKGYI